ncbi:MAG: L-threonylcarbamoyladenylate synthase [Bacteroidales bacterium]|nr:L-threonylcarbamoyladenylate synthase [Bacteroidales bacterium]
MTPTLIDTALHALRQGLTLLYPTDTIWGIGCDATNEDAVERIYRIKERDHNKSMLVLANEQMLAPHIPSEVRQLLLHSQRPTTVILPIDMLAVTISDNLPASDGSIGVRIPQFDFCQQLLHELSSPLVSTSANLSGHPSPACYADIDPILMQRIDCCLPDHTSFHHPPVAPSRIIRLNPDGTLATLRE